LLLTTLANVPSSIFAVSAFQILWLLLLEHYELIILFLTKQWVPELRRFAPNVPVVLVGTKLGKETLNMALIQ